MRRRLARRWAVIGFAVAAALPVTGQGPGFKSSALRQPGRRRIGDADEVRIVFSEPMVAVGTA